MGREIGGKLKSVGIYVYLCQFMLQFDRKEQNSVKQLSFNKQINKLYVKERSEHCTNSKRLSFNKTEVLL